MEACHKADLGKLGSSVEQHKLEAERRWVQDDAAVSISISQACDEPHQSMQSSDVAPCRPNALSLHPPQSLS